MSNCVKNHLIMRTSCFGNSLLLAVGYGYTRKSRDLAIENDKFVIDDVRL